MIRVPFFSEQVRLTSSLHDTFVTYLYVDTSEKPHNESVCDGAPGTPRHSLTGTRRLSHSTPRRHCSCGATVRFNHAPALNSSPLTSLCACRCRWSRVHTRRRRGSLPLSHTHVRADTGRTEELPRRTIKALGGAFWTVT